MIVIALAVNALAVTGSHKHLSLATELEQFTLVQYVGSIACLETEDVVKVCHPGLSTTGFSHLSHNDQTICTKLHEEEGTYQVDACASMGESCPDETCGDCKGFFHNNLVLDKCNEGYMLVKGDVEGCTPSDVALGRWCNKVPSKVEEETTDGTEAASAPAEEPNSMITLASALQSSQEAQKRPHSSMLTLASAYSNHAAPLPSQGFEGAGVAHKDKETATSDWRREYGPGTVPRVVTKAGANTLTVTSILFVLIF